jgi:hypothetical protein
MALKAQWSTCEEQCYKRAIRSYMQRTHEEKATIQRELLYQRLYHLSSYIPLYITVYDTNVGYISQPKLSSHKLSLTRALLPIGIKVYLAVLLAKIRALDNTRFNQIDIAPVIPLGSLAVNQGCNVRDGCPEGTAADIFTPRIPLGIENLLTPSESVVVRSLQRPLTDKVRELCLLRNVLCLATDRRVNNSRIRASGGEVVHVCVNDDGVGGVIVGSPEFSALKAVLDHHGDTPVKLLNAFQDTVQVPINIIDAFFSQACRSAEADEVSVRGFVDGGDGETVQASVRGIDVVENPVNGFPGVREVRFIVEPAIVVESFAYFKRVDAAGKRVETNDDVHIVALHSIPDDAFKELDLVTRVKLGAGDFDPGCVRRGDT